MCAYLSDRTAVCTAEAEGAAASSAPPAAALMLAQLRVAIDEEKVALSAAVKAACCALCALEATCLMDDRSCDSDREPREKRRRLIGAEGDGGARGKRSGAEECGGGAVDGDALVCAGSCR